MICMCCDCLIFNDDVHYCLSYPDILVPVSRKCLYKKISRLSIEGGAASWRVSCNRERLDPTHYYIL